MAKKVTSGNRSARKYRPKKRRKGRKKKGDSRIILWITAVFIIILGIIISLPYIKDKKLSETGASVPAGAYCYGIDISHYQHSVEWDSLMVMTDGRSRTTNSITHSRNIRPVSYVFIKATEGINLKDKKFRHHWKKAEERDIRRGAYHFFRSSKDPEMQADFFIKTVGPLRYKDLPPVLDIETIHRGCSYKELNEKALIWLKKVEKHYGRKPIVYSSASFIEKVLCEEIKSGYPIWVAHYETDAPRCSRWHFWQFTDKAIVHGVDGPVDLNVCTLEILDRL